MSRYCGLTGFGLLTALAIAAAPAAAQDVLKLGEFQDWTAYSTGSGAEKVCYVVSEAKTRQPAQPDRQAFIYVTHRPSKKTMGVVMAYAGHSFKPDSEAVVEIGKGKFALFTHRDTAWAPDADSDNKLLKAMRAGKALTIRSTPADGAATVDTYSLTGIAAALKRIGEACPIR